MAKKPPVSGTGAGGSCADEEHVERAISRRSIAILLVLLVVLLVLRRRGYRCVFLRSSRPSEWFLPVLRPIGETTGGMDGWCRLRDCQLAIADGGCVPRHMMQSRNQPAGRHPCVMRVSPNNNNRHLLTFYSRVDLHIETRRSSRYTDIFLSWNELERSSYI